jgi:hypothetical protein
VSDDEWAQYGVGEPDENGWYADYRIPPELKPVAEDDAPGRSVWWSDIIEHWGEVLCDMSEVYGIDLYDPVVLARPWPGVRTMVLGLLSRPSRLSHALED